ncbi:MAG: 50S ribosomal protein L18 [Parcubacteria group bacterium]|nr:50S ribosomal protein L18 [Parcubacteria group bacterium]
MNSKEKQYRKTRRHKRIRAKISGTLDCPRLSIFRSNQHLYSQLIDDINGRTLLSVSDLKIKKPKTSLKQKAKDLGLLLAEKAKQVNIKTVVFDRGGYKFHGIIKEFANAAREGGLKF